jgi:hypothetical protein
MINSLFFFILCIYMISYHVLYRNKSNFEYNLYNEHKVKYKLVKFITLILNITFMIHLRYNVFKIYKFVIKN